MTPATLAQWKDAQKAELRYHLQTMLPANEREWHAGIAGLLRLDHREDGLRTVIDVACGPMSLLLDYRPRVGWLVDPLDFLEYEEGYKQVQGLVRVRARIEDAELSRAQEVWCYNCLQHVADPNAVLVRLTDLALERIRIFEWTREPMSEVHLHTLDGQLIASQLHARGFVPVYQMVGSWQSRTVNGQHFYAAQWARP